MEKNHYLAAAAVFVLFLIIGLLVDYYRDKRRKIIIYDHEGRENRSNVTSFLMMLFIVGFLLMFCLIDICN